MNDTGDARDASGWPEVVGLRDRGDPWVMLSNTKAENGRLRAALDEICGIALGCKQDPDFPAAKIHKIVCHALERKG